jgi:alpha-L-rhamnosidase
VKLGATTMWERWDGWTPEKGFQDPGMNSFNHYAFGSVGQWLYGAVAGIETDGVAFKSINIRPIPGHGLTHATARYESPRGEVVSGWKLNGDGKLTLDVTVPPNTTATVSVPAKDPAGVTEGGKPAKDAKGVEFLRHENGAAVYKVGSGRYTFAAQQEKP